MSVRGLTRQESSAGSRWRGFTARPLWVIGLCTSVVAAIAAVLVYVAARALGVPMELTEVFEDHFARMPVTSMVWAALLEGGIGGTLLAMACRRWAPRPRATFLVLTGLGFLASYWFPIVSDATLATKVALSISHLVVASIIVPALAAALPRGILKPRGANR